MVRPPDSRFSSFERRGTMPTSPRVPMAFDFRLFAPCLVGGEEDEET